MVTVTYMYCDECGMVLPKGREMRGVMKQGGQFCAELCFVCTRTLTVDEAIVHMEERAAGTRPRPTLTGLVSVAGDSEGR
jgi:hypothetical protein